MLYSQKGPKSVNAVFMKCGIERMIFTWNYNVLFYLMTKIHVYCTNCQESVGLQLSQMLTIFFWNIYVKTCNFIDCKCQMLYLEITFLYWIHWNFFSHTESTVFLRHSSEYETFHTLTSVGRKQYFQYVKRMFPLFRAIVKFCSTNRLFTLELIFLSSQLIIGELSNDSEAPCSFYIKDIRVCLKYFILMLFYKILIFSSYYYCSNKTVRL